MLPGLAGPRRQAKDSAGEEVGNTGGRGREGGERKGVKILKRFHEGGYRLRRGVRVSQMKAPLKHSKEMKSGPHHERISELKAVHIAPENSEKKKETKGKERQREKERKGKKKHERENAKPSH